MRNALKLFFLCISLRADVCEGMRFTANEVDSSQHDAFKHSASTALEVSDVAAMRELWTTLKAEFNNWVDVEDDQLEAVNRRAMHTATQTNSDADVFESTCVMCDFICKIRDCQGDKTKPAAPTWEDRFNEFKAAAERCDIVLELDAGHVKPSEMVEVDFVMESQEFSSTEEFEAAKDQMYAEQTGRFDKCSELLDGEREAGSYRDNLHICAERIIQARREHEKIQTELGGMFPQRKYKDERFVKSDCRFFTERGAQGAELSIARPNRGPLPGYQLPQGWGAYARMDGGVDFLHAGHCEAWKQYPNFLPYCRASSPTDAWAKDQMWQQYKWKQARQQQPAAVCSIDQCHDCLRRGGRFCNPASQTGDLCRNEFNGRTDYTDCMRRALLQQNTSVQSGASTNLTSMEELVLPMLTQGNSAFALVERSAGIFRTRRPWEPGLLFDIIFGIISGCARFVHWVVTLPLKLFPSVFQAIISGFIGFKNFWMQGVGYTSDHLPVWPWCWAVKNGPGSLYNHRVCR